MSEHSKTPWRVFTSPDGLKLVGIGTQKGEGILDSGFGVWSLNYPEGIAKANLVVNAVNSHDALVNALENVRRIIAEGALTGFNYKDGDWAERLFESQQVTSAALASIKEIA